MPPAADQVGGDRGAHPVILPVARALDQQPAAVVLDDRQIRLGSGHCGSHPPPPPRLAATSGVARRAHQAQVRGAIPGEGCPGRAIRGEAFAVDFDPTWAMGVSSRSLRVHSSGWAAPGLKDRLRAKMAHQFLSGVDHDEQAGPHRAVIGRVCRQVGADRLARIEGGAGRQAIAGHVDRFGRDEGGGGGAGTAPRRQVVVGQRQAVTAGGGMAAGTL